MRLKVFDDFNDEVYNNSVNVNVSSIESSFMEKRSKLESLMVGFTLLIIAILAPTLYFCAKLAEWFYIVPVALVVFGVIYYMFVADIYGYIKTNESQINELKTHKSSSKLLHDMCENGDIFLDNFTSSYIKFRGENDNSVCITNNDIEFSMNTLPVSDAILRIGNDKITLTLE